jgi:hypothetical protein
VFPVLCFRFGVYNFAGISRGIVVIVFVVVVIGMFIQGIKKHPHSATAYRQQWVQEFGLGGQVDGVRCRIEGRGAVRGRESRQQNVSAASLPKVPSEWRVRHATREGCGSAGR